MMMVRESSAKSLALLFLTTTIVLSSVWSFVVVPPTRHSSINRAPHRLFMSEPVAKDEELAVDITTDTSPAADNEEEGDAEAGIEAVADTELEAEEATTTANGVAAVAEEEEETADTGPEMTSEEAASIEAVADTELEAEEATTTANSVAAVAEEEEETADSGPEMTSEEAASAKRKIQRERFTLFVGNLPFDKSDGDVRELFAPYGKVELVTMPRNKDTLRPRGFAFVDMSTPEELEACIEAVDGFELNGRTLRVTKSVPKDELPKRERKKEGKGEYQLPEGTKKLYCGNLPFTATKEEIADFYKEFDIEILDCYIPSNQETGQGRGFAFLTVKEEDMDKAIEMTNGMDFGGRTLVVNEPLPKGEKAGRRSKRTKIYVGNLAFHTVPATLAEIFEEFGEVFDCYLPEDPASGGARGFGFITMSSEEAQLAIDEINGCEVDGRVIRVNEAQPKGRPRQARNNEMDDEELGVISGSWDDMDE